ncbi:MAG: bacteriohemerythrin [Spirochaetaceae bacterium]|nr:bacteriohemerythrin [Spirochaetaceae bacterium]
MSIISIIFIFFFLVSTVVFILFFVREKSLFIRVLNDISDRSAAEKSYPERIEILLDSYKMRNQFREKSLEEAQISANESERGSTRLSRNIQKALIYSSGISVEAEKNKNVATSLYENVSEGSAAVEEIIASIRSLKDKVNIQNEAVNHTSGAVSEINSSLKDVSDLITHRKKDTEELVIITGKGSDKVQESAEVMSAVQNQVTNALSLITVIDQIASQTNLLSMNAAIEAAHAGDSGKGFAVVAEEIRKLAESTAENARNISVTLRDLVENIESAGELSRESEKAFTSIASGVKKVSDTFRQIGEKTETIFNNTQDVVSSTVSLKDISAVTALSMNEMEIGAAEIEKILNNSKNVSEDLDMSMKELSRNSKDINLISTKISNSFIQSNNAFSTMIDSILSNQVGTEKTSRKVRTTSVILGHLSWVATVRAILDGAIKPEDASLLDQDKCELGKWIEKLGEEELKDRTKLKNLKEYHRDIHSQIPVILKDLREGKRQEMETHYLGIQDLSGRIVQILTTLGYNDGLSWDDSISVKIDLFDTHHKKLIGLINQLYQAMEEGNGTSVLLPILEELIEYTAYHFSAEEEAFEKYSYPGRENHIKEHSAFVVKAEELYGGIKEGSAVLTNEVLDFLQDWVVNHIMKVDFKYSDFLSDKNIS